MVIFGASGDLTQRKLVPALYNLALDGLLPEHFQVVGVARRPYSDAECVDQLTRGVKTHSRRPLQEERWEALASRISYVQVEANEVGEYHDLGAHLEKLESGGGGGNRLFYLATPPSAFSPIVRLLGEAGLNKPGPGGDWARVVVEKPTGTDLESARALNRTVNEVFHESSVYRIDHYLGKETVQNLMVFRFANAIFEPLWNHKYIDHVQLTVAESLGVGTRGSYYEEAGTTRDMVQNHMFQLLCLTAMEPPVSLRPDAIRDEKVKVLEALRPVEADQVRDSTVRGQYAEGVIDSKPVPGYLQEDGVSPESRTETYVALKAYIDNWRWADVPFYLRAGKRMNKRITEIALQFKGVPHRLFSNDLTANTLALRIQPDEGISLRFGTKMPGTQQRIQPVKMDFEYGSVLDGSSPEAYERLILDALVGDSTLFIRRDEVQAAWTFIDRLQEGWHDEERNSPLAEYTAGTWGPAEAHVMLAQDGGRKWRRP
jgi:glucose-6-phosphate 1-dehydrogenase